MVSHLHVLNLIRACLNLLLVNIRYDPGGHVAVVLVIWKVSKDRNHDKLLNTGARILNKMKRLLYQSIIPGKCKKRIHEENFKNTV